MSETLLPIVQTINSYLSDYILFFMLIAVGLFYSFKTRFVQVRCFKEGMSRVFGTLTLNGKKHDSGMSSFQALEMCIRDSSLIFVSSAGRHPPATSCPSASQIE